MRLSWHTTRAWLPLLLLCAAVSGCKTVREAQVRTEYRYLYQRDSVYVDCTDTLYVFRNGDTVTIREKVTEREYHYTVFRDTLRQSDTLRVEKVMVAQSECPKKKVWPWFVAGFALGFFIIFAAKIVIRFFIKK